MPISNLHIMQVSFLPELIALAKNQGVHVDKILFKTSLSKFNLSNPDSYVPLNSLYDFLLSLEHKMGCPLINGDYRNVFSVKNLGSYGSNFLQQPDLLKGFEQVEAFQNTHKSNLKIDFTLEGSTAKLTWYFIDQPSSGRTLMERITFAQLMDAFKLACSANWEPLEVNFTSESIKHLASLLPSGNYKINCKQAINSVTFSSSLLLTSLNFTEDGKISKLNKPTEQSDDLPSKIQLLIQNCKHGRILGLDDCSDIFNLSERQIRRNLAIHNTSFLEIHSRVQFLKSIHFLENENASILEISQILGYSNSSNFIKAFKKWAQTTPALYRNNL